MGWDTFRERSGRPYNKRLVAARLAAGFASATAAAKAAGIPFPVVCELERGKASTGGRLHHPYSFRGDRWNEAAEALSRIYKVSCEDLWPEYVRKREALVEIAETTWAYMNVEEPELPDARLDRQQQVLLLVAALARLPRNEQVVLTAYFGLGEGSDLNSTTIARARGVSASRVKQLKEQGLARLRRYLTDRT